MDSGTANRPGMANEHTPVPHGSLADEETGPSTTPASGILEPGLSCKEYVKLDEILSRAPNSELPSLEALDGFLVAIALSPYRTISGGVLDRVCDEMENDDNFCFRDTVEEVEFKILVLRHLHDLIIVLGDKGQKYEPALQERERLGEDWARGFEYQRDANRMYWEILTGMDEKSDEYVLQIFEIAWGIEVNRDDPEMENNTELSAERRKMKVQNIASAVEQFQQNADMAHAKYNQVVQEAMKQAEAKLSKRRGRPSRNAPCPCGSGKKYKNCCGQRGSA